MLWVVVLGLLATMPLGIIIGSAVPSTQKVGTWGMLPIMLLAGSRASSTRSRSMWGWVQVVAQMFPMYWMGSGCDRRSCPMSAAALEIGESLAHATDGGSC